MIFVKNNNQNAKISVSVKKATFPACKKKPVMYISENGKETPP